MKKAYALMALSLTCAHPVFAESSATDPLRMNIKIEQGLVISENEAILYLKRPNEFRGEAPMPAFLTDKGSVYCKDNTCFQLTGGYGGWTSRSSKIVNANVGFEINDSSEGSFEFDREKQTAALYCGLSKVALNFMGDEQKDKFEAKIHSGELEIRSLPSSERRTEYYLRSEDGEVVYVDASKNGDSIRAYVGGPGEMKELKIRDFDRYRNGGTTIITFEDGRQLLSPTPLSGQPTNFDSKTMTHVDKVSDQDLAKLGIPGVPSAKDILTTPCH